MDFLTATAVHVELLRQAMLDEQKALFERQVAALNSLFGHGSNLLTARWFKFDTKKDQPFVFHCYPHYIPIECCRSKLQKLMEQEGSAFLKLAT